MGSSCSTLHQQCFVATVLRPHEAACVETFDFLSSFFSILSGHKSIGKKENVLLGRMISNEEVTEPVPLRAENLSVLIHNWHNPTLL